MLFRMTAHTVTLYISISLASHHAFSHEHPQSCDRERSRLAREIIQQFILTYVARSKLDVPPQCIFHASRDKYLRDEQSKGALERGQWRCGYCGKVFRGEHFLDAHMHKEHFSETQSGDVCLADYCPLLHCDYFSRMWAGEVVWKEDPLPCRKMQLQEVQRVCMAVATDCFLQDGQRTPTYEWFVRHFCGALTCDAGKERYLLRQIPKMHQRRSATGPLVVGVTVILLIMFYVSLWMYFSTHQGYHTAHDLQRLGRRRPGFLEALFGKPKAY